MRCCPNIASIIVKRDQTVSFSGKSPCKRYTWMPMLRPCLQLRSRLILFCVRSSKQCLKPPRANPINSVMPKSRRKPPRVVSLPRLVVPVGLGLILALSAIGFVFYTKITLYKQAHFAPEYAHPWDGYAALCLFLGMAATAGLVLNKRDPPPMRWRRGRVLIQAKKRAKRRRAGTIPLP